MTNDTPTRTPANPLRRFAPLIIFFIVALTGWYFGVYDYLSLKALAESRDILRHFVDNSYLTTLVVYILVYIVATAFSVPGGVLLTISGGFLFGWLIGGLATVLGASIGASIIFLIAKTAFGETLASRAGPFLEKLSDGFQRDAFSYLLFLRLVPAFPFWLVNLAPALLGVGLPVFALATFIGIIPGTFTFAFLGAGLDSIIDEQKAAYNECLVNPPINSECVFELDPSRLLTPQIIIAFIALGLIALLPVLIRKIRTKKN